MGRKKEERSQPLLTAAYTVEKFGLRKKLVKNRFYSCEENIGLHFIILVKCKM